MIAVEAWTFSRTFQDDEHKDDACIVVVLANEKAKEYDVNGKA